MTTTQVTSIRFPHFRGHVTSVYPLRRPDAAENLLEFAERYFIVKRPDGTPLTINFPPGFTVPD